MYASSGGGSAGIGAGEGAYSLGKPGRGAWVRLERSETIHTYF